MQEHFREQNTHVYQQNKFCSVDLCIHIVSGLGYDLDFIRINFECSVDTALSDIVNVYHTH